MDGSVFSYFWHASPVVKIVMMFLLGASVLSWALIFQKWIYINNMRQAIIEFENQFWSGAELGRLYQSLQARGKNIMGLASIFNAGFKEYMRLRSQKIAATDLLQAVQRSMRVSALQEQNELENHLPTLATIGSVSPYVGLFGTVWGIMMAFHALGGAQQMTIAMVAPGISEALIATAMGLFAAVPAYIFYNRFSTHVDRLLNGFDSFQDEFSGLIYRQAQQHKQVERMVDLDEAPYAENT